MSTVHTRRDTGRIHVVLLFGGRSSEHEISCLSAGTIDKALNRDKYDVYRVYITKEGKWRLVDQSPETVNAADKAQMQAIDAMPEAEILPGAGHPFLAVFRGGTMEKLPLDIAFPVLHGKNGEDGTIQGLFEMARLPYVGCGVLSSAVSMDKIATKHMCAQLGIRMAKYIPVIGKEYLDTDEVDQKIRSSFGYPVFVKPANAGSTVGVSKAGNKEELSGALALAAENDSRILVEEAIVGREVETAVLGNADVQAAGVGEILSAETFYTYDAKYHNPNSRTVLDPDLPAGTVEELRRDAVAIFKAVDGKGLARVDFFVEKATGQVVFNELNTMPGFTSISMYPMLWNQKGLSNEQLADRLIELGFAR